MFIFHLVCLVVQTTSLPVPWEFLIQPLNASVLLALLQLHHFLQALLGYLRDDYNKYW